MFIPQKTDKKNQIARPDKYVVYGWQRSYFTHKLTAAMHFYQAPWEFLPKTSENAEEIRLRSGTHQIPVLHTPENWMIADTTPLLHMLDGRFPERAMFPKGKLGILVQILEEYFDEWIARTTVHWRWNYPENHELLSMDAAYGDAAIAQALVTWGSKVCRATGVDSEIQKKEVEKEYYRILDAAEAQLQQTDYLLGDRPTALDCIVLAGLRAHFLYDPAPKKAIYEKYPIVVRWVEESADQWDGSGNLVEFPETTPFGHFILKEMQETYQPFALGNSEALQQKQKAFIVNIYGEEVSYLARPYIEQSRQMIVDRIHNDLTPEDHEQFLNWLESVGLESVFKKSPS